MTSFPLGDVLSITTGRLVSRDHIEGVYRVCDYMTGHANMTHQLPRVMREAAPIILEQHPELAGIEVPDTIVDEDTLDAWLTPLETAHGATVNLEPMTAEDHTSIDPIAELRMMRPDLPIIVVEP